MTNNDGSTLLRRSLLANAAFSGLSGLVFLAASQPLAAFIGLTEPSTLTVVAVCLLLFAGGLFLNARRPVVRRAEAWAAVALDFGWVLGSGIVIWTGVLSVQGNWAVAAVADVVLLFAILQLIGLCKFRRASLGCGK
jgi:hypothetical protein